MLVFIISAMIGVAQVIATERAISFKRREKSKIAGYILLAKIAVYVILIAAVSLKNMWQIPNMIMGFLATAPATILLVYIYHTIYKKYYSEWVNNKLRVLYAFLKREGKKLYLKIKEEVKKFIYKKKKG